MGAQFGEAWRDTASEPVLFTMAERLVDEPQKMATYDHFKWLYTGNPSRERRKAGDRPWPRREGEQIAYSHQVFSGFDPEHNRLLEIAKDPWIDSRNPRDWLVVEADLNRGTIYERRPIVTHVNGNNELWMQLEPQRDENGRVAMNRTMFVTAQLEPDFTTAHAEIRDGRYGGVLEFEDMEALESMIVIIQHIRWAQNEAEMHRWREMAMKSAIGKRGKALADVYAMAA